MADLVVDGAHSAQPYFSLRTGGSPTSTYLTSCSRLVLTSSNSRHLSRPRMCLASFQDLLALNRMTAPKMGERMKGHRDIEIVLDQTRLGKGVNMVQIQLKSRK